ncbi:hypothetical protein [Methanoculleus sp.]|uniref:hypothetical protein n=1 Tax=Methanoculleus sp. TaxID=90427 RepID=UPI0025D7DB7D|nr:hypothetical protein [Methanoculleus sp.]MCK9319643.1 hypothetical protein [Methanoculleus sp.]
MKLISCNRCGVVFDQDNINFPDTFNHDTGELIDKNASWNDALNKYVPKIECPVCGADLIKEE